MPGPGNVESLADSSVDSLSQQIGMAHVLCVLPNQVHEDLSDRHGLAPAKLAEIRRAFDESLGVGNFRSPSCPRVFDDPRIGINVERKVLALVPDVEPTSVLASDYLPEPVLLYASQMPYESEQRQI